VIRIGNLKESEKYVQCLDSGFSESVHVSALLYWRTSCVDHKSNVFCTRNIAHLWSIPSVNDVTSIDQLCKDDDD
jgi:hypothetical protein